MLSGIRNWLNAKGKTRAHMLYIALVAQARNPFFYQELQVPDTLDGRFELILLHLFPVLHRLKGDPEGMEMARRLTETCFADMDRSLRELGVGDTGISRRVKQMANAFYGRMEAYENALGDRAMLEEALRRNVYATADGIDPANIIALAAYVQKNTRYINARSLADLQYGALNTPNIGEDT